MSTILAEALGGLRHEMSSQRMIGMALDAGGHLTHGFRPNISGKLFEQPATASTQTQASRLRPRPRRRPRVPAAHHRRRLLRLSADDPNFRMMREIADEVDATLMVDMAHFAGLVAG